MRPPLPTLLRDRRPGIIELAIGEPEPALLPAAVVGRAAEHVLRDRGPAVLAYGAPRGPGPLVSWLAEWLSRREGRPIEPEQLMISGGSSAALAEVCLAMTEPGELALCETPTYHLAAQTFRDHRLDPRALVCDESGIVPAALAERIDRARAEGQGVGLVYTVPTHANPTGRTTPAGRRDELVAVCADRGVLLVEDDPYREIFFDVPPPPLGGLEREAGVIRLGSFSKLLAPGLRLGWLLAAPEQVEQMLAAGWLESGGGPNHMTAMIVHRIVEQGDLDRNLSKVSPAYAERAAALVGALREVLPEGSRLQPASGGFFVWAQLPESVDTAELLPLAERAGVGFAPGFRFGLPGGPQPTSAIRLAFCGNSPELLVEGARRLGRALEGL
jgi:DNA-binding transcriptional MocR family regulator